MTVEATCTYTLQLTYVQYIQAGYRKKLGNMVVIIGFKA